MSGGRARSRSARPAHDPDPLAVEQTPATTAGHGDEQGTGQADAQPSGKFPAKRAATPDEIAKAGEQRERIHALAALGTSASMISRITRLPVAAIEGIMAEPVPPVSSADPDPLVQPTAGAPPGGSNSAPGPGDDGERAGRYAYDDTLQDANRDGYGERRRPRYRNPLDAPGPLAQEPAVSLYYLMTQGGLSEAKAKLIGRSFRALSPNDYAGLRAIMLKAGVAGQLGDLFIDTYRNEVGDPAPPSEATAGSSAPGATGDENARLRRQLAEARENRLLEAQIRALERENQGGSASPELEELRRQNALLLQAARDREQRDAIQAAIQSAVDPVRAQLSELQKQTGAALTSRDAVELDGERRRIIAQDRAMTGLVEAASQKLQQSGSLQTLAKSIIHAASPELQSTALAYVKELKLAVGNAAPAAAPEATPPTPGETDLVRTVDMLRGISGGPRP